MDKEYILCAAIVRTKPSTTKTGNYKTNSNECDDIYFIEIGRRHNDILARFGKNKLDVNRQGFYTSFGRFVDRRLAMEIAIAAGQVKNNGQTFLYSEDLY